MHLNIATIVLNGQPWIEKHLPIFAHLSVPWTWSIAHGIADPVKDTSWCKHLEAVEDDGTRQYLRKIGSYYPQLNLRFSWADRWAGKTAQINAALEKFTQPGILLQVDADEIWTTEKLEILIRLFEAYPWATHAAFACRFFVGPRRVVTHPGGYGNRWNYEWIRAWRFTPGQKFVTHEPPELEGQLAGKILGHAFTMAAGLTFDHMSYATAAQVAFKEKYYDYPCATEAWARLQNMRGPVNLRGVLPWIQDSVISYELP